MAFLEDRKLCVEIKHRRTVFFHVTDWVSLEVERGRRAWCVQSYKTSKPDAGSWRVELHVESVKGKYPRTHTEIAV